MQPSFLPQWILLSYGVDSGHRELTQSYAFSLDTHTHTPPSLSIPIQLQPEDEQLQSYLNEIALLESMRGKREVVNLLASEVTPDMIYLVLELGK